MNYGQLLIKESHEKTLFRLVREHRTLSRADLKRLTGYSATTVSTLADGLIERGLFVETGIKEVKTSGRKATLLQINPAGGHFICVHISKKITSVDCLDLSFKTVHHFETETSSITTLSEKIKSTVLDYFSKHENIVATVVAQAGVVKQEQLISASLIDVDSVNEITKSLRNLCSEHNTPFFLLNESALIVYAETTCSNDLKDVVSININEGVGAGMLVNGHLFTGIDGAAGEFGHNTIDCNGPLCTCGSRGCLELYVSIPAIIENAKKIDPSVDDFSKIVVNTEKFASVIDNVALVLSFGIVNIINLFDPQKVVISGPLSRFGDAFLEPLKRYTSEKLLTNNATIEYSSIKSDAAIIGGAKYAFDKVLI